MHMPRVAPEKHVGDERDLLFHALPVNQRGDTQHLAHAGATHRTFIADNQNIADGVFALADGIDALLFIFKYAR